MDSLFDADGELVLDCIRRLGRSPRDLKQIALTHAHRSHLGGLATLKRLSGALVYAHEWEADIIAGERLAQPVSLRPQGPPIRCGSVSRSDARSTCRARSTEHCVKATSR